MNVLVDTNILVYAYDKDAGIKHNKAFQLLEQVFNGEKELYISNQNLAELFKVLVIEKNVPIKDAKEIIMAFIFSKNWIKVSYKQETIIGAMHLYQKGFHFWDCLIAATALENFINIIYTENTKDFKNISGMTAVNPLI